MSSAVLRRLKGARLGIAVSMCGLMAVSASAQWTAEKPGSDNIEVLGHLPLGPRLSVADIDVEQEMDRPFAYVARMVYGTEGDKGLDIINIADPEKPERIYKWRVENQDLHLGTGGMDVKHFKWKGRYYVVQSLQFRQGGPNPDLGAVILDVTGLPDPSTVKEVARIRDADHPGGFHNIFVYKHSAGPVLLVARRGQRLGCARSGGQRMGVDVHRIRGLPGVRGHGLVSRVLRRLLRR